MERAKGERGRKINLKKKIIIQSSHKGQEHQEELSTIQTRKKVAYFY